MSPTQLFGHDGQMRLVVALQSYHHMPGLLLLGKTFIFVQQDVVDENPQGAYLRKIRLSASTLKYLFASGWQKYPKVSDTRTLPILWHDKKKFLNEYLRH